MHSVFAFKDIMKPIMAPATLKKPLHTSTKFIDQCIIPTIEYRVNKYDHAGFFNKDHIDYYTRIAYTDDIDIFLAVCKPEYYETKVSIPLNIGNLIYYTVITTDLPQWYNMTGKDPYLYDKKIFIITTEYITHIKDIDDSISYMTQLIKKIMYHINPKKFIESSVLYGVPITDEDDYYKMASLYMAYGVVSHSTDTTYDMYEESKYAQSKFKSSDDMMDFMNTLDKEFLQDTRLHSSYF